MNEQINIFIEELIKNLGGLPEEEVNRAICYYEEYLAECLDAGRTMDSIIDEIGTPKKIGDTIRIEANIQRTEKNPGLINFTRLMKAIFKGVSTPISIFSLSLTAILTYALLALIFASSVTCLIAGAATLLICVYQGVLIPFNFFLEIIGTFGMGLLFGGILSITAYYLWKLGRLLIKLSMKQLSLMLKLSGKAPKENKVNEEKSYFTWIKGLCIASIVGFILFSVSGLPWRFFTIFNSMKSDKNIVKIVKEYDIKDINKIQVSTTHSRISVEAGNTDKIILSYEQPDWLSFQINSLGGILDFREISNGRLPLFEVITLHSIETKLSIILPENYTGQGIVLESRGGYINIENTGENVSVKTTTGYITYNSTKGKSNISAQTGIGIVYINGASNKKNYKSEVSDGNNVRIVSDSGYIYIRE